MVDLFNKLDELDKKRINNFICKYGINETFYKGNEEYLKDWNKNKQTLYHLLGNQFTYSFPFNLEKPDALLKSEVAGLYRHPFVLRYRDCIDNLAFVEKKENENDSEFRNRNWVISSVLYNLINSENLYNNRINAIKETIRIKKGNKKELQISKGMSLMKSILKIMNYFNDKNEEKGFTEKDFELFEDFRIKHSLILNDKEVKGDIVISIHPLDFLTMSDNAEGWSSCMSWAETGCYHVGSVEMMNSNNVAIAYLKANKPYIFDKDRENGEGEWNSKRWRSLVFITPEIILAEKAYPFANEILSKKILEVVKNLAKDNLNWDYSFGPELYKDMKHIYSSKAMNNNKEWIKYNHTTKHNIIFDTNGMYNDMLAAATGGKSQPYWCYRNKTKKNTIINISGPCSCLCCDNQVIRKNNEQQSDYYERYSNVDNTICSKCYKQHSCVDCGSVLKKDYIEVNGELYCKWCYENDAKICPCCGKPYVPCMSDKYAFFANKDIENKEYKKHGEDYLPCYGICYYTYEIYFGPKKDGKIQPFLKMCICDNCIEEKIASGELTPLKEFLSLNNNCDETWKRVSQSYVYNKESIDFEKASDIISNYEYKKYITKNLEPCIFKEPSIEK